MWDLVEALDHDFAHVPIETVISPNHSAQSPYLTQVWLGRGLVFEDEIARRTWYWRGKSLRHPTQSWGSGGLSEARFRAAENFGDALEQKFIKPLFLSKKI